MFTPLAQALILLAGSVFLITLVRRLALPTSFAYLLVGLVLGPHALGVVSDSGTTRLLAELGVAFLLFTLGLDFSLPRMLAMRREVFGLGALQVLATTAVFAAIGHLLGIRWPISIVLGGAVAMSSTAMLLQQLTERAELNRTHGRLAFAMLLFQDLAFVPFFALAAMLSAGQERFRLTESLEALASGVLALVGVLVAGRWLLRPLFREISHSRLRELFTLTVLLVVLASAWVSHLAGLSFALGAFLAGMMLAETEYRYQIDSAIRPFRDLLLGLFFVSVGMLLNLHLLGRPSELAMAFAMLVTLVVLKAVIAALVTWPFTHSRFKALRTGIVMSIGGEFGIALCTVLLQAGLAPEGLGEPLLVAIVLSMVLSPVILNHNKRVARFLLHEHAPALTAAEREEEATQEIAQREHVILCGFGRVGQNVARVLESQGFEYIALDLDPARIRAARQAGDPVMFGDSADEEMLARAGIAHASALVISFSDAATSLGILRSVRRMHPELPVLVRTADDARLQELQDAGATDVVPETFEASLMLVSHVLMLLRVPVSRVVRVLGEIRNSRYAVLRNIVRRGESRVADETSEQREEIKSVVVPPGAWAVGRSLSEVRNRGVAVTFTGVRRHGILGREPAGDTVLRDGDIVVIYGQPEELERAEAVLLAG
ncbi:MAG TPA: cation:proton antiporter [Steroidobacteraceae bacterium]|jgi:CPA2 family monovalent cation:H+ antiporter-2|nr:cation:proton antiporter [Steroidobacteraceae bacterium]